jgi:addiction module HigA family antidote
MAKKKRYHAAVRIQRPPTHPGALLREDVLPAMQVTVSQAAAELRVSRQLVHRILAEKAGISADMAVRLGKYCGNGPDLWLRLQQLYDLWHAEQSLGNEVKAIPTRPHAA